MVFDAISSNVEVIMSKILKACEEKKEEEWEGIEEKFKKMQEVINIVLFKDTTFGIIARIYTQKFGVHQKIGANITR